MLPVRRCTHSGITGPGTLLPTLRVPLAAQECSPSTRFYGIPKTYARRFEVVDLARCRSTEPMHRAGGFSEAAIVSNMRFDRVSTGSATRSGATSFYFKLRFRTIQERKRG